MNNPVIHAQNIAKTYHDGGLNVEVLKNLDFSIAEGESVSIIGSSGSGKSTLLHLLGGLDKPDSGSLKIMGKDLAALMPLLIGKIPRCEAEAQAADMLAKVGLAQRIRHRPAELSGGERQRAAIARALANRPKCLLADEPTGNLDRKNARLALDLMLELQAELGTALIVVTHDDELAARFQRVLTVQDGKLSPFQAA